MVVKLKKNVLQTSPPQKSRDMGTNSEKQKQSVFQCKRSHLPDKSLRKEWKKIGRTLNAKFKKKNPELQPELPN